MRGVIFGPRTAERIQRKVAPIEGGYETSMVEHLMPVPMLYKFTLATGVASGEATGNVEMPNGDDSRANIVIIDLTGKHSSLQAGAQGWCTRVYDKFYFTDGAVDSNANNAATFQLTEPLVPGGVANATVLSTDIDPAPTSISVQSVQQRSPINAKGVATLIDGVWVINEIQQPPLLWTADLTGPTHDFSVSVGGGGSVGSAITLDSTRYTNRQSRTGYPYNLFPPDSGTINNVGNLHGLSGDRMLISYNATTDTHVLIAIYHALAKRFMFKLTADRPASGALVGTQAYAPGPGCSGGLPDGVTVHDPNFVCINAKANATGIAEFNYRLNRYEAISCSHIATRALGQLSGNFTGTPATFTVNRLRGLDGDDPSGSVTVRNRYNWEKADIDKPIAIEWDHKNEEWVPYQMECPS